MRNNEERFGTNPLKQEASPLQQIMQQSEKQENESVSPLQFIVPTEFVELPSKGLLYPPNHPLHHKETIEIKQMTAKEEDILNSRSLLKKGIALDRLIQALIVDKSINPDSLTIDDRGAIIIAARIAAYGPEYATEVVCPSCSEKTKNTFNLSETTEKKQDSIYDFSAIDTNGFFTVELPVTKWKVVCRALTGNDEKIILKISEAKKKNNIQNDSLLLDQIKLSVVSLQGVTSKDLISRAIDTMPARDSKFLRTKYQEIVPSFKMIYPFACNKCEYEADMEVPLSTDFFWFK